MRRNGRILRRISTTGLAGAALGAIVAVSFGGTLTGLIAPLALLACSVPQTFGRERAVRIGLGLTAIFATMTSVGGLLTTGPSLAARAGAMLVLVSWSLMLCGVTRAMICRPRSNRGVTRAAVVTLLAWLWLAWPIWLGPTMALRGWDAPAAMTALHPLFATNAATVELGIWTQQPLVYALTPLGQDVAYALPRSVWPCVGGQMAIAAAAVFGRWFCGRRFVVRS